MIFTSQIILTYLNLRGVGRAKVFKLAEYAKELNYSLSANTDFYDYYQDCRSKKVAPALPEITLNDIKDAYFTAGEIIEASERNDIGIVSYYDDFFPENLKFLKSHGKDAQPILLHYKGKLDRIKNKRAVAIIGTREATTEGILSGEFIGKYLADQSINIVSGLAIGCDTAGHVGALKSENGLTTAVLAHGLDTIYPKENKKLAEEILDRNGLLISEYPIGSGVRPNFLVERDRIQAGLADATIVIQTGLKGGTMHAVSTTLENNKYLFAVSYKDPLLKNHEKVKGNEYLIEQGKAIPLSNTNLSEILSLLNQPPEVNSIVKVESLFDDHDALPTTKKIIKAVIFDLDMTLVDTSALENYRKKKQWSDIDPNLISSTCQLYPGIAEALTFLRSNKISINILTTSPSSYAKKVMDGFNIKYDNLVAYHDVKYLKPSPEGLLNIVDVLPYSKDEIVSFGDRDIDIVASRNADIVAVACLWGASDVEGLKKSKPNIVLGKSGDLLDYLRSLV